MLNNFWNLGADVLVAGSYVFKAQDYNQAIEKLLPIKKVALFCYFFNSS